MVPRAELRAVGADGALLGESVAGDVEAETWLHYAAKMRDVVVEEPGWVDGWREWCAGFAAFKAWESRGQGHVDFGELGVEACVFGDAGCGDVVGVCVFPVRNEEHACLVSADHACESVAGFDGVGEGAIGKVEEDTGDWLRRADEASGLRSVWRRLEGIESGGGFDESGGAVAFGCWAAIGEIADEEAVALVCETSDGATHADLGVIGVGGDNEDVDWKSHVKLTSLIILRSLRRR